MSNKEMIVYKNSFASKVANFFRRIFRKNTYNTVSQEIAPEDSGNKIREAFLNSIQVENTNIDKISKQAYVLNRIDENIEELNNLSIEQLRELDQYYDNVIEENDKKIKKLQGVA